MKFNKENTFVKTKLNNIHKSALKRKRGRLPTPSDKQKIIYTKRSYNYLKWVIEIGGMNKSVLRSIVNYMRFINHIAKFKGLRQAVSTNKRCRTLFVKYLAKDVKIDSLNIKLT